MSRVTIKVDAVADAYGPEEAAKLLGKGEATIWRWIDHDSKRADGRI